MKYISIFLLLICSVQAAAAIDVIVHPSNNSALNNAEITRIFLGKAKSFPGGGQAVPLNQNESAGITAEFNKNVLNKSNSQLKAYWSKLVFTGKGTPPKSVDSEQEVINLISSNTNMIGFISKGAGGSSVRVVATF